MNKDNKNTEVNNTDKKLHISDVSSSASNGFRPNVYISDDLEDLKRRYTPEQNKNFKRKRRVEILILNIYI